MIDKFLERIDRALDIAGEAAAEYTPGKIEAEVKSGGDPVTELDLKLDDLLKKELCRDGEGWLSEETADDPSRLDHKWVWIVDPLDGTREFVEGINQWCISIGLAKEGKVVAGGILNPAADEKFIGSVETGVLLNGEKASVTERTELPGSTILASRTEVKRGQWDWFEDAGCNVIPMGSVAYKLARVSAGLADATFTLVPKNEWDIAAGTLLVEAAGGFVINKKGNKPAFNRADTLTSGLIACGIKLSPALKEYLKPRMDRS